MSLLGMIQVKIQKGTTAIATANTAVTATISDVSNVARCVVLTQCRTGYSTGLLTNTTTLSLNSNSTGLVEWTVIEFGGASV